MLIGFETDPVIDTIVLSSPKTHPGWVAPKDWAEAVLPSALLQEDWKNELPFSKELFDATEHRGMLTDEKTKRRLIRESEALRKQQAEASKGARDEAR